MVCATVGASEVKHLGCIVLEYQLEVGIKPCRRFDHAAMVFLRAKMHLCQQDFIHILSWCSRTVHPMYMLCAEHNMY